MHILHFILCSCALLIVGVALLLTYMHRAVQVRMLPLMIKLFIKSFRSQDTDSSTIKDHHALFTAMSTTIGIATIAGPVIAIRMGGPGALIGIIIGTLLGTAVNYTEVTLALQHRYHCSISKRFCGGPMQYLGHISPYLGRIYALFAVLLLCGWSAAQTNQLCAILNSPLLKQYAISPLLTSPFITLSILLLLLGGIQKIARFSALLVPFMFVLYVSAGLWILLLNYHQIPSICSLILHSAYTPISLSSGLVVGGFIGTLRWGILKAIHANEAGLGTQAIPHSNAQCENPSMQGVLAMASSYAAGFIAVLSGMVALVTGTWNDPHLSLGIDIIAASFGLYFSEWGIVIIALSTLLFAYGTILGNSYNGSECFLYITKNRKWMIFYYLAVAATLLIGGCTSVRVIWNCIDYLMIPVLIPHLYGLLYLTFQKRHSPALSLGA